MKKYSKTLWAGALVSLAAGACLLTPGFISAFRPDVARAACLLGGGAAAETAAAVCMLLLFLRTSLNVRPTWWPAFFAALWGIACGVLILALATCQALVGMTGEAMCGFIGAAGMMTCSIACLAVLLAFAKELPADEMRKYEESPFLPILILRLLSSFALWGASGFLAFSIEAFLPGSPHSRDDPEKSFIIGAVAAAVFVVLTAADVLGRRWLGEGGAGN